MDILSLIGQQLGGRVIGVLSQALSGLEPGKRYPHPQWGPIVIPKKPSLQAGEPSRPAPPIQITFPGFLALSGGILLFAHYSSEPGPLGAAPQPEQKELFPQLKREMRMTEAVDAAESDDPVEICLQRRFGWKLKRLRELRESIAGKSQPAIFKELEESELTRSEEELVENIDACLDQIKKQYGSLEAAGIELTDCPLCEDDD